jgi:hypothetical protein
MSCPHGNHYDGCDICDEVDAAYNSGVEHTKKALAAQPAVPDAIHHTDLSEHPQYIEGWNDCRQAMLEMTK